MYCIRKANIEEAVPLFIKGLEDKNRDVRYQSIMGLAETIGKRGEWAPSKDIFIMNEKEYIDRWRLWWNKQGKNQFRNNKNNHG